MDTKKTFNQFDFQPLLSLAAVMLFPLCVHADEVSPKTIAETWKAYGEGVVRYQNRMLFMQEHPDSSGVMVVSPQAYNKNLTCTFII